MELDHVNCNLCGSSEKKVIQVDEPYEVVKCKACGLIYVNPQPDKEELFKYYSDDYYLPWLKEQCKPREKMWARRLKKLEPFKKGGKLLDVGCGTAVLLNQAKKRGWQVWGTEVSHFAVAHAKEEFAIDVFEGELMQAKYPDNFFDAITIWHVLEHTFDPLANLREVERILKPDGIIILAVPNIHNYIYKIAYTMVKLKKPKLFHKNIREIHLYHFSTATLKKMLIKANLSPVKFDVDTERIFFKERIVDAFSWFLYKIIRINIAGAIEVYCRKTKE